MSTVTIPLSKYCRVCGDLAKSFNFNGLSCEPCKGFFRRNVTKIEKFQCNFKKNCPINKNSRKGCKKCRIEKCLAIGMKQNLNHVNLFIENHQINHSAYEQAQIGHIREAVSAFGDHTTVRLVGQVNTIVQALNLAELFVRRTVQFCNSFAFFTSLSQPDQLTLLKRSHPEISFVYGAFLYDQIEDAIPMILDVADKTAIMVKLDMDLCCSWQLKHRQFAEIHRTFLNAMHHEMDNDCTIRDLLMTQQLFKPRTNLTCQELIRYNHAFVCHLLARYLQRKYMSTSKASKKMSSIMLILEQINFISAIVRQIYIDCASSESNQVAQVMAEIFNFI